MRQCDTPPLETAACWLPPETLFEAICANSSSALDHIDRSVAIGVHGRTEFRLSDRTWDVLSRGKHYDFDRRLSCLDPELNPWSMRTDGMPTSKRFHLTAG